LAVVRAFDLYMTLTEKQHRSYPDHQAAIEAISRELEWVKENLPDGGRQDINNVQAFVITATGPTPETQTAKGQQRGVIMFSKPRRNVDMLTADYFPNPQTAAFCSMLQIDNKVDRLNSLDP
jgi:lariat debranching enzyme